MSYLSKRQQDELVRALRFIESTLATTDQLISELSSEVDGPPNPILDQLLRIAAVCDSTELYIFDSKEE